MQGMQLGMMPMGPGMGMGPMGPGGMEMGMVGMPPGMAMPPAAQMGGYAHQRERGYEQQQGGGAQGPGGQGQMAQGGMMMRPEGGGSPPSPHGQIPPGGWQQGGGGGGGDGFSPPGSGQLLRLAQGQGPGPGGEGEGGSGGGASPSYGLESQAAQASLGDWQGGTYDRLYVSNIPRQMAEQELLSIFSQFGPIGELQIHRKQDGASKGTAFVSYGTAAEGYAACSSLARYALPGTGRPMLLKPSTHKRRSGGKPTGGGSPLSAGSTASPCSSYASSSEASSGGGTVARTAGAACTSAARSTRRSTRPSGAATPTASRASRCAARTSATRSTTRICSPPSSRAATCPPTPESRTTTYFLEGTLARRPRGCALPASIAHTATIAPARGLEREFRSCSGWRRCPSSTLSSMASQQN